MIKRVAAYVLTILVTCYLFLMYTSDALSGILMMELLYPLAAWFYIRDAKKKLHVELGEMLSMGEAGKRIPLKVIVRNESPIWGIRYRLFLATKNSRSKNETRMKASKIAGPASKDSLYYEVESDRCGTMTVSAKRLHIYDFLGVFYGVKKLSKQHIIGIMPKFRLIPVEITRRTREFPADADEYSTQRRGNDPSEIYQIREYQKGDSIHDVHWKLSAKEDELMVKEHALPLGCSVLIWLNLEHTKDAASSLSSLLEQFASLSISLVSEKCIHMAAWYEEADERVVKWKIDSEESLYECMWNLLHLQPYKNKELAQVHYENAFRGVNFSSIVEINHTGRITVNQEVQELLQI